jgi:hypothetical protein
VFDSGGAEDQIGEGPDKPGGIAYGGHHFKLLDAQVRGVFAGFYIYFVKCFDVLGDERNGNDEQLLLSALCKSGKRRVQRGLEPLLAANSALKAKCVRIGPAAVFHN